MLLLAALLAAERNMMMKRRKIIVLLLSLLAVALVLAAATFWLDFRAAQGNTRSESQVSTYSTGVEQGQPKPAINQLTIYVEEPGSLMKSVRQGLVKRIQDTHGIQDLRVVEEMPQGGDGPALYVQVTQRQFLWLPVFTRGALEIRLVYASDGDLSWMDDTTVIMESSPLMRMKGDFSVADTSFGLMTLRGQARYLGRQAATELVNALNTHLY
jgi:hypothetical protein